MSNRAPILRGLACAALALAGPWAGAQDQVRVTPGKVGVRYGTTRTFTAVRRDNRPAAWEWRLEGAPPGAVINEATGAFQAPGNGTVPIRLQVRAIDRDEPEASGRATVVVTPEPIVVFHVPPVVQDDTACPLQAERTDGLVPTWAWTVRGPGGRIAAFQGTPFFHPPRVTVPTGFELRVQDTRHPQDTLTLPIRVVPSLAGVRFADAPSLPLRPGGQCLLEATLEGGPALPWSWKVLEPGGGHVEMIAGGQTARARYTAPRVAVPTTFHVRALQPLPFRGATLAIPVQPDLKVTASGTHVLSGGVCLLRVTPAHPAVPGVERHWQWRIVDPEGPSDWLIPRPDPDEVAFTAPRVGWPTPFTLEVHAEQDPEDRARIRLLVLPPLEALRPGTEAVFERMLPGVLGDDWLAPMPQATLLAGRLGLGPEAGPAPFHGINCICFVPRDPVMAALGGHWLVGDREGIKDVSPLGEVTPHPTWFGEVTALAARPRGSAPGDPCRLAFATVTGEQGMVSLLEPGTGETRPLAGTSGPLPPAARLEVGQGPRVAFGRIESLVWTGAGDLDVVDRSDQTWRVRRIAPDGQVTLLLTLKYFLAMAWDPAQGVAFAAKGHALSQVALDGRVHPLVGGGVGFKDGVEDPAGGPALVAATGLQRLGPYLFFADTGNRALRVFNLETKTLQTLAGHPDQRRPRLGPLAYAAPGLHPEACAALAEPRVFAVNAEGGCVVAQKEGLVHLDLGLLVQGPPEPEPPAPPSAAPAASASPSPAPPRGSEAAAGVGPLKTID